MKLHEKQIIIAILHAVCTVAAWMAPEDALHGVYHGYGAVFPSEDDIPYRVLRCLRNLPVSLPAQNGRCTSPISGKVRLPVPPHRALEQAGQASKYSC